MDPVFAPGYMGLSRAYRELGTNFRGAFPAAEMLPKAIAAAEKALQLDPDLAEAHALLAVARHRLWQWSDAEGSYRQSLQLEPNSAAAHVGLAHLVAARGRLDEAVQLARRARALDPLSPAVAANVCWTLYLARQYGESIRECRSSLELQPDNHSGLWYLGGSLREASLFDEAEPCSSTASRFLSAVPGCLEAW
jgi:tetratricopeptide (TPR) repeat protein